MRKVVITADDFGLAPEVNEGIEAAHRAGVLTAASLMVGAPACADAVRRARALPSLRVGLHLTLVEARPVLPAEAIPDLVDGTGHFRSDMARAGAAMFFRPAVRRQLRAEVEAQFRAYAATGLPLDHVNAHKHFHIHPTIAGTLVAVGRGFGLRAVRVPREPALLLRRIEPLAPVLVPALTAPFTALLARRLAGAGLAVPDQVFGLAWSGALTADRLLAIAERLPDGLTEIYAHPATAGGFPGSAPGYRYADELAALMDPAVRDALRRRGAALGGYADFA